MINDQFTSSEDGQAFQEIKREVNSADVYVWAHYGHGYHGDTIIVKGAPSRQNFIRYSAMECTPADHHYHRFSEVVVYSCQGERGDWMGRVASHGSLYATPDVIFGVGITFFKTPVPYYPLNHYIE